MATIEIVMKVLYSFDNSQQLLSSDTILLLQVAKYLTVVGNHLLLSCDRTAPTAWLLASVSRMKGESGSG